MEGQPCTLTLDYEYSWLIGDPDAFLVLDYVPGKEGQGLKFDPPLGQALQMADGTTSLSWSISVEQPSDSEFELQFAIPRMAELPKSPQVPGCVIDIAQAVDAAFDQFEVVFGTSTVYPCQGTKHTLTVKPKPSSPLLGEPVRLFLDGGNIEKFGVRVTPALENPRLLTEAGLTWELDCVNGQKGDFTLQLGVVGFGLRSLPLPLSLAHNLVTAERWSEYVEPGGHRDPYYLYSIRATSPFLGPVYGVKVTLYTSMGTAYMITALNGEAIMADYDGRFIKMEITNLYDGSVV
ncbi:hypothetical protein DBR18_18065 [Pseudomonas sp. HMWF021]|nr:hypothetical protein DBR18_18065 [Pseudomonas sp. HMWF021]